MRNRQKTLTYKDCIIIARKCRRQLAYAQGQKSAIRLLRQGFSEREILDKSEIAIKRYSARLNEVNTIRSNLDATDETNFYMD